MGQWLCNNPKVVGSMYTKGIKGIKSVIKTRKENGNKEKVTGPELEKTANVVFVDLLKSNKKFIADTENPTDVGKMFISTVNLNIIGQVEQAILLFPF